MKALVLLLLSLSSCVAPTNADLEDPVLCPLVNVVDKRGNVPWTQLDLWTLRKATKYCDDRNKCLTRFYIWADGRYSAYCSLKYP